MQNLGSSYPRVARNDAAIGGRVLNSAPALFAFTGSDTMPTTKPKPKSRKLTILPPVRCLDLANRPGSFVAEAEPLGHKGKPPKIPSAFGAPRYSQQLQKQNPDKPLTRVVKDVLPVGSWKVGHDTDGTPIMWDVTREQLETLSEQFALAQSRGVAMNLTKSHGDPETLIVPTDDLVSPIDQVVLENDVLWISSYVTPEQAKQLQNPAMKVSPGVTTRFEDGHGNKYPLMLYHTAVIDQPTVTNQGRFLALANKPKGGKVMDQEILDLFKQIFEYEEMPLPDTVTTDNAMDILPVLISQLTGTSDSTEDAGDAGGDSGASTTDSGDSSEPIDTAAMTLALRRLNDRLDAMETHGKRTAFESRVAGLVSTGKITAASAVVLNNSASKTGYDQGVLNVFDLEPSKVPMGRRTATLANPAPPRVGNESPAKAPIEDRVSALLGTKKKKD